MPWTEKQLRLFRAAAHNPEIAKRTGIKQSDAERMSKEGLKKMASGGEAKQKILRQDTRHGKVDMPFEKLGRFAGMKKGGFMKKRRFDEGGDVDYEVDENAEPERKSFASGVSAKDREYTSPKAPAKKITDYGDEGARMRARYGKDTRPVTANPRGARGMGFRRDMPSDAQKDLNAERIGGIGLAAASALPVGAGVRAIGAGAKAIKAAKDARELSAMSKANEARFAARRAAEREAEADIRKKVYGTGFKKGGLMRPKKDIGKDQMSMAPYKKGGEMESKSMMKKEISFMKKKGAPASMIKHEKAETKGYKKGGSIKETMGPRNMSQDVEGGYKAQHLKHGEHSEQKRGHTKGTVIKMAAGGSVRAHGEHSIQKKGHTRGKMC